MVSFVMPSRINTLGSSRILSNSSESRTLPILQVSSVRSNVLRVASGGISFQPFSLSKPSFTANYRQPAFSGSELQTPSFRMDASSSFNNFGVAPPRNDIGKFERPGIARKCTNSCFLRAPKLPPCWLVHASSMGRL